MMKISVFLFAAGLAPLSASAEYVQTCRVKYMTESGWSKVYEVQVTFMRGSELNSTTSSYNYQRNETYACIFWKQDQVSVIELEHDVCGGYSSGGECEYLDFHRDYAMGIDKNSEGTDQKGIKWKVCWSDECD
jgi:hypothetical protein